MSKLTPTFKMREMPLETLEGMRPPAIHWNYFSQADHFAFDPRARNYSDVNAWWLADACMLVYGNSEFVREKFEASPLPHLGYSHRWLEGEDHSEALVLEHPDALVVVFRGTRVEVQSVLDRAELVVLNEVDLQIDGQFLPKVFDAGGHVHSGFLLGFERLSRAFQDLIARKRPEQALWLTGHSLGGALATIAAASAGADQVHGLYTYGCPLVGDARFVSVLPTSNYYRFVHREDVVTHVPPAPLGYCHGGVKHEVIGSGKRNILGDLIESTQEFAAAMNIVLKELHFRLGDFPFRVGGIADHAPAYYAGLLWNALIQSKASNDASASW